MPAALWPKPRLFRAPSAVIISDHEMFVSTTRLYRPSLALREELASTQAYDVNPAPPSSVRMLVRVASVVFDREPCTPFLCVGVLASTDWLDEVRGPTATTSRRGARIGSNRQRAIPNRVHGRRGRICPRHSFLLTAPKIITSLSRSILIEPFTGPNIYTRFCSLPP